jgi:hypothetical protein
MDVFVSVDIPDTHVGPAGTSFFVGVIFESYPGEYPAALDMADSQQRSWLGGSSDPIDPNNLGAAEVPPFPVDLLYEGDWLIRAVSVVSFDCYSDGVPDECELCGDLDGDEDVDYYDYVVFLDAFGGETDGTPAEDWCCDYDKSGAVGMTDYAAWLECYRDYVGNPLAGPPQKPKPRKRGFTHESAGDSIDSAPGLGGVSVR